MEEILIYLLKSTALLSMFYLVYVLLLKKDTDFVANRRFLFGGIVAAAILPAITFTRKIWIDAVPYYTAAEITETSVTETSSIFNIWEFAGWIYIIVTLIFLLRLTFQLISVVKLISAHPIQKNQDYYFIETSKDYTPFSFFWYIIYNPEAHSKKELDLILCHEKVHARQRHSIDILFANLTTALLWFNPLSWFYKKSIEQNLEFIADKETVEASGEKTAYQQTLVKITARNFPPALTNQFYQSLIKKRILMLNKNQKPKQQPWKMMLLFPLILAFMLSFNVKTEARILKSGDNKYASISEDDQQILEAHFSENTSQADLETYKSAFAEKNVQLQWRDLEYSNNKLINIHVSYTLETGDSRSFQSKTDKEGRLIPFKINAQFEEKGKVAFITIDNKKSKESIEPSLAAKEMTRLEKEELPEEIIYKIDGKVVEKEDVEALAPETIAKMKVLKGEKAYEEVGREAKDGVILITTKDPKTSSIPKNKEKSQLKETSEPSKATARNKIPKSLNIAVQTIEKPEAKNLFAQSAGEIIAFQKLKTQGENSESVAKPLIIIDGIPQSSSIEMNSIDSANIGSIHVLKGETAVSTYGEKGENGVILIRTKKD